MNNFKLFVCLHLIFFTDEVYFIAPDISEVLHRLLYRYCTISLHIGETTRKQLFSRLIFGLKLMAIWQKLLENRALHLYTILVEMLAQTVQRCLHF